MRLIVNGEDTEYKLGDEKSVYEFIKSFDGWATQKKYIILKIAVDGKNYVDSLEELKSRSIEETSEISIEIEKTDFLIKDTITQVIEHIDKLIKNCPCFLKAYLTNDKEFNLLVENYREGIAIIEQVVDSVSALLKINTDREKVNNETIRSWIGNIRTLKKLYEEIIISANRDRTISFIAKDLPFSLSGFKDLFSWLLLKSSDTSTLLFSKERLNNLLSSIKNKKGEFEEIATLLQTGNKIQGIEKFVSIIDNLQDLMRELNYIPDLDKIVLENGKNYNDFIKETMAKLSDIVGAFERDDMVLLSDLVEYELSAITDNLIKLVEKSGMV
ncbi:MAG: hypothetical protein AB1765_11695 [Candidatus Hydrogenedentota bacterium]